MNVEHHDILSEFPEHKARIHELKMNDQHFRRIYDEYSALDHTVRNMEEGTTHCSEAELEEMKKKRVQLKDEIYAYLKKAA